MGQIFVAFSEYLNLSCEIREWLYFWFQHVRFNKNDVLLATNYFPSNYYIHPYLFWKKRKYITVYKIKESLQKKVGLCQRKN